MPYKVDGKTVYVYKGGKWEVYKTEATHSKAVKLLQALVINVLGKGKEGHK